MCGIPSASRCESRQHNRGEQRANRITKVGRQQRRATLRPAQSVPRHQDIESRSRRDSGLQECRAEEPDERRQEEGKKFRQIVDFRERNAILGQERFQIFLCALLCMETDGVPRYMGSGQIIVDIEQIMLGFFDPETYDIRCFSAARS